MILLLETSLLVIRREGVFRFFTHLLRWASGRRNYRKTSSLYADPESETPPHSPEMPHESPSDNEMPIPVLRHADLAHPVADSQYEAHIHATEPTAKELSWQHEIAYDWHNPPRFSIITPVYQPASQVLRELIDSVRRQTYPHWKWYLVDASLDNQSWEIISAAARQDVRLIPIRLDKNHGISGNTNIALHQADGDFIAIVDHDDTLARHALFTVAKHLRKNPQTDLVYSDVDKLDLQGRRVSPLFSPDWSPETMLCANIVAHLCVFRRSLLDEVGYYDPSFDGAQDWEFYLRISRYTQHIEHIPEVLYHWRQSLHSTALDTQHKPYAQESQIKAITHHLVQLGLQAPDVYFDTTHPIFQTHPLLRWQMRRLPRITTIIPSRNQTDLLRTCLESLYQLTSYPDFEVIVIDTGSTEQSTYDLYDEFTTQQDNFNVLNFHDSLFNFSRTCNFGAQQATGDLLLFLNNDTEILQADWLELMAQWFEIEGIGVVGAKLLYPDGRIQHAGIVVGIGGLASHIFYQQPENVSTLMGPAEWYRNQSAVTGACLMIKQALFEQIGGFDDNYQLPFNDVQLCLDVIAAGYRIVYTPHVRLIHCEGATRHDNIPPDDVRRALQKWRTITRKGDPYYNPNLSYAEGGAKENQFSLVNHISCKEYYHRVQIEMPDFVLQDDCVSGFNFVGNIQTDVGLAELSRLFVKAALKREIEVNYVEVERPHLLSISHTTPVPEGMRDQQYQKISLLEYNINGLQTAQQFIPDWVQSSTYRIGTWVWELSEVPSIFRDAFRLLDEVWVNSQYVHDILEPISPVPVVQIPVGIEYRPPQRTRADFRLPEDRFLFLYSFSHFSSVGRKNPFGVIEAFGKAFGSRDDGPLLVIKPHYLDAPQAGLVRQPLKDALKSVNGFLLDDDYSYTKMRDLIQIVDCYVSLHRSEGLGLGMAEAMTDGKPVIATGYSGNMAFMNDENCYPIRYTLREVVADDHKYQPEYALTYPIGHLWAEPDIDHAAEMMQYVFENQDDARRMGEAARSYMQQHHSLEVMGRAIEQRLNIIQKFRH